VIERSFGPVVPASWLQAHLGEPGLRVVDATWYMPHVERDAHREFLDAHIPGAVFFDIDDVADPHTTLPHMLPSPERFGRAAGELGIGNHDRIVVYGARNMIASARVWWMFRVFGHEAVAVLDGGLPRWKAERRPLESGARPPRPAMFTASLRSGLVADLERMRGNLERRDQQLLDARSVGRFVGTDPEPRPGLRSGHIPGSLNLPYDQLFTDAGMLLPISTLRRTFEKAGLDLERPVVTTCGSGVSAGVLALGLHLLGRRDTAVYDGSWTEWGGRSDTPVER
jgi:thiosulfate/3-mercaptopyruvate sulfurtransferase